MIKLQHLTIKNFLSVGALTQAIDFSKDPLTLVVGENLDLGGDGQKNGVGKSAILNALSFALYGQAITNIKKDNLVNLINGKNMLVTITFEKNGTEYRIERGRKPNILKLYINNKELQTELDDSQGDSRETQKSIESILGLSHVMFRNIITLNTYSEPFLSMRAADQREIIEQLLGITLLSEKAESLKEQLKATKDEIARENAHIEAAKKSNDKIQGSIDTLKAKQAKWIQSNNNDRDTLENSINDLLKIDIDAEIQLHTANSEYTELNKALTSLKKEYATVEAAFIQSDKSLKKYVNELSRLEEHVCPLCEQSIHSTKHEELRITTEKHVTESQSTCDNLSQVLAKLTEDIQLIGTLEVPPKPFYRTIEEAYSHQNNLEHLHSLLSSKIAEVDPYQEQIDELTQSALQEISWDQINALSVVKDHQEFLLKLLTNKDSFIRKKIIDQNLAYLNSRLSFYLDHIGLPHQVVFQNDLSVTITQLGQDLDFHNLSRGEMTRLILSLSFAFRDVYESLYDQFNLLFIDELIDNGLDMAGVENSLSLLKRLSRERAKNVFLISHRDELLGRVNNILKVIKENGFSNFEYVGEM